MKSVTGISQDAGKCERNNRREEEVKISARLPRREEEFTLRDQRKCERKRRGGGNVKKERKKREQSNQFRCGRCRREEMLEG